MANIEAMLKNVIDLHAHTSCSDGSVSPSHLVTLAYRQGASAVAITDHDTVAGLAEGRGTAEYLGIEFINGIEISADYSPGTMHILGYCINPESRSLSVKLDELRSARNNRNPKIAARLQALGFDISYDDVVRLAGNEVIGRPHFARLMVERNYVQSIQDAFDRFLAKGAAAYVEKSRLSPAESIALIHEADGVAVLAHPYQLKLPSIEDLEHLVHNLTVLGLDGIEAIYSRHSMAERDTYTRMAMRHDLLVTGGSDYHGSYKPDIDLVTGKGDLEVPYKLIEKIKARAAARANAATI
jgi:3',5'-nucleoside bisphosphate phosphatase